MTLKSLLFLNNFAKALFSISLETYNRPSKIENNAYANFWRDNKECYGIFFFGRKEMVA